MAASALQNSEENSRLDGEQSLTCNDLQTDFACNPDEEDETSVQVMRNGSAWAGSLASINCLYDIAELLEIISNSCDPSSTENLIHAIQLEDLAFRSL